MPLQEKPAFQWSLAALQTLMAEDQHDNILRTFSIVELWWLRRVFPPSHRWGTAQVTIVMSSLEVNDDDEDPHEKFESMAEQCGARVVADWQPTTQTTHLVTSPSATFPQPC